MPSEPFRVIEEDEPDATAPPPKQTLETVGINALMLGLGALSKRFVIGLASLFTLITCTSMFWLALAIIPKPDLLQLAALVMYAIFVVGLNLIVRR